MTATRHSPPPAAVNQYWHDPEIPDEIEELFAAVRAENRVLGHRVFNEKTAATLIEQRLSAREAAAFSSCAVPAMQADYFRYCVVYALGGVYCDADLVVSGSFRSLLETDGEIFQTRLADLCRNDVFAFRAPGHPLLRMAIDIATTGIEARFCEDIPLVTGPWIFSRLVAIRRLGSLEAFAAQMEGMTSSMPAGKRAEMLRHLEIVYTTVGDYRRVVDAFDGVRISPARKLHAIAGGHKPGLRYKETETHYGSWTASIYR